MWRIAFVSMIKLAFISNPFLGNQPFVKRLQVAQIQDSSGLGNIDFCGFYPTDFCTFYQPYMVHFNVFGGSISSFFGGELWPYGFTT
jgi:hypothetical protein